MSSTVAIIAATSAGNSAAIAAAERAHDRACQGIIQGFDAKGATTQAQIAYADCVHRLNPPDITGDGKVALALIMIFLVGGFLLGAIKGGDFGSASLLDRFMFGLMGLCIAFVAVVLVGGLAYGMTLVLS
jgi:hypothetical protein